MSKRRRNRKVARPDETQPIDVYKRPLTEAEQQDERDALTWEPPTFSLPGLDEVLENTAREAEQMLKIYKL